MSDLPRLEDHLSALPLFPLPHVVFFPGTTLPLHVFEPRYRALTRHALDTGSPIAVPQILPERVDDHLGTPPFFAVAGVGAIVHHEELEDGRLGIVLRGLGRVQLGEAVEHDLPFRVAAASLLPDSLIDPERAAADVLAIHDCLRLLVRRTPNLAEALRTAIGKASHPGVVADRLSAVLFRSPIRRQNLLESTDVNARLARVVERLGLLTAGTVKPTDFVN